MTDLTFEEVVDLFIAHYAKPRQRTWDRTEKVLKRDFSCWIGRPFHSITEVEGRAIIRSFIANGRPGKALQAHAWVKKLWRWAFLESLVATAVMDRMNIEHERRNRERYFDDAEIKAIWSASSKLHPNEGAYFKSLVLLAPRCCALGAMRRSDIVVRPLTGSMGTEEIAIWITPPELTKSWKSKKKKRCYETPLPAFAQTILNGLPSDGRLFPKINLYQSPAGAWRLSLQRTVQALVRRGAPKDFFTHAMRHTVATWLSKQGHSEWEIALVLNHATTSVTAGYTHSSPLRLKLTLLQKWSDHVERLVATPQIPAFHVTSEQWNSPLV